MTWGVVLEGVLALVAALWFGLALSMLFSIERHRYLWLALVAGLAFLLTATSIDFFSDVVDQPHLLFTLKNASYGLGGVLLSIGMAGWSRLTIASLRSLERLAAVDELTGVLNRRQLLEGLDQELVRAQRSSDRLTLLMADIDDLKQVNDRHGHLDGDKVLRCVGTALRDNFRRHDDMVGRFGGDEFIVLARNLGPERVGERVTQVRESFRLALEAAGAPAVGLSLGLAVYPEDGPTLAKLIDTADGRMYRDKFERKEGPA